MIEVKSRTKKLSFFFLILAIALIPIIGFGLTSLSPVDFDVDDQNIIRFSGTDVIKNFKLESFGGNPISSGGFVEGTDNRLIVERGSWSGTQSDVKVVSVEQVGEMVFVRYQVTLRNTINIRTNSQLDDICSTGKTTDSIKETFKAGDYKHYDAFNKLWASWTSNIEWYHLDYGNVRDNVLKYNSFSGDLVMSFDIDDSPFPSSITDANGNTANKSFAYISVADAYISSTKIGHLSSDAPKIVGLQPSEFDKKASTYGNKGDKSGTIYGGFSYLWNPNTKLGTEYISNTMQATVSGMTKGSSLNPTTKTGQAIWEPTKEVSLTNCRLTANVASISPYVVEYSNKLTWTQIDLKTQEYLDWFTWKTRVISNTEKQMTAIRTTGVHITNRYIQSQIAVAFDVYSAYKVEAKESDIPKLEEPEEYYDDIVFNSAVEGFGGGSTFTQNWGFSLDIFGLGTAKSIIVLIVIAVVVGIVIYAGYKVYNKRKTMALYAGMRK